MTSGARREEVELQLQAAASALDAGGALDLVDEVADLDRRHPDDRLAVALVALRHAAFDELDRTPGRPTWPASFVDPFPAVAGLPEIGDQELTGELLGGSLVHHGCLRVEGLLSEEQAAHFRDHIERSFDARARLRQGGHAEDAAPWFVPFSPGKVRADGFGSDGFVRAVDAPLALRDLRAAFVEARVVRAVTDYFRERPAMIANKWVLRRTPSGKLGTDFHQDGAFLGEGIRTVDCWIALSHCGPGTGRPGIDLVPHRFPILPSGEGAAFEWSLTEAAVRAAAADASVVSPVFAPGDALFFDERLPHRTSVGPELSTRHAIESWFVAPSSYPARHVPVVL